MTYPPYRLAGLWPLQHGWQGGPLAISDPGILYNNSSTTITGRGVPGETVTVEIGGLPFGTAVVNASYVWSVTAVLSLPAIGTTTIVASSGPNSDALAVTVAWPVETTNLVLWLDSRVGVDTPAGASIDLSTYAQSGVSVAASNPYELVATASGTATRRIFGALPGAAVGARSSLVTHILPTSTANYIQVESSAGASECYVNLATGVVSGIVGSMTAEVSSDGIGGWNCTFSWIYDGTYSIYPTDAGTGTVSTATIGDKLLVLEDPASAHPRVSDWNSQPPASGIVFSQSLATRQIPYANQTLKPDGDGVVQRALPLAAGTFGSHTTHTIFFVVKGVATGATGEPFLLDAQTGRLILGTRGFAAPPYQWGFGDTLAIRSPIQFDDNLHILEYVFDAVSTNYEMLLDGNTIASGSGYVGRQIGGTVMLFNDYLSGSIRCWSGELNAVLAYSGVLDSASRLQVRQFLASQFPAVTL